jgi:hypothetical protein
MDSKIDLKGANISDINYTEFYKIDNIKLINISNEESKQVSREDVIESLLPMKYSESENPNYINEFFTPIPKEFADVFINNTSTIKILTSELESFVLKIEVKKL